MLLKNFDLICSKESLIQLTTEKDHDKWLRRLKIYHIDVHYIIFRLLTTAIVLYTMGNSLFITKVRKFLFDKEFMQLHCDIQKR